MASLVSDTLLPPAVHELYNEIKISKNHQSKWCQMTEHDIWKELCFCLLSGNVSYELTKSVIDVLDYKGFLDCEWILNNKKSHKTLFEELNNSNFKPRKNNGDLRRYRYPAKRSIQIIKAAKIIYSNHTLKQILSSNESETDTRSWFVKTIPGLGIKESSHFLRNIGFSDSLAIIDIHVLAFLKKYNLIDFASTSSLTTNRYLVLEKILQNIASYHDLEIPLLDLAIWHYMRHKTS